MTSKLKWIVGGVALAALAGTATFAGTLHRMTVSLPQGGSALIEYSGNIAPRVSFSALPALGSDTDVRFWSPFAEMDRVSAMMEQIEARMDRQMQASLRQMPPLQPEISEAGPAWLPPGTETYSLTTIATGQGVCTRELRLSSRGEDMKPTMISRSSGCGDGSASATLGLTPVKTAPQETSSQRKHI